MSLVFVDLDGTLLRGASCERAFMARLARDGALGPRQGLAAALFVLRWAGVFGRQVFKKNKAWLTGLETAEIARRAAAFDLAPRLRSALCAELARERASGARLVLLTGAPDFLAAPIARAVGAEICCATLCAQARGRFTADPPLRHPFGPAKLALAREIAGRFGTPLALCAAYADSIHDAPLLAAVGRPVAVAPDRGLRALAKANGWRILQDPDGRTAGWRAAPARPRGSPS